jgi:glycosyltransferase involved in cell wall biosynthesis
VSVVLPTYNERESILRFLAELGVVLDGMKGPWEILVLDDASPDGTGALVETAYGADTGVRVVRRRGPRGLGFSIRDGLAAAAAPVVVVMDADFNHDPQVVPRLVKYLDDFDLVSGSRFAAGGGMYSRSRQAGSFLMNILIRVLLGTQIQDNLSGFFAARRVDLARLPAERIYWGHGDYYFRLLYHAQRRGLQVLEIPVVYRSREGGGSKTPLLRTATRYSSELVRFRIRP